MRKQIEKGNSGITLIALVVTIIVLLILATISIGMLSGNNGILKKSREAKSETIKGEIREKIELANLSALGRSNGEINLDILKQELAKELGEEGTDWKIEDEKANPWIIESGDVKYPIPHEEISGKKQLGEVYTDNMIGQKITYSSNGQSNWIVFGKDTNGNILITTELPIENGFNLKGGAEAWIKYESETDKTYGLNYACSGYGGTIQGKTIKSRSIKMEDINYVAGLNKKTVTVDGNTYNIQSFDTYTFGTTNNYSQKKVNYFYPILSGGTGGEGTGTGFWKKPNSENETTFDNNWYNYYCNWDDGKCYYAGPETNGNDIDASTVGLNTDKLKYIWGGNTKETCYKEYLVASRSVRFNSGRAVFNVARVGYSAVGTGNYCLCGSNSSRGNDDGDVGSIGIRPIAILPSSLLVEDQENGTYDLAE